MSTSPDPVKVLPDGGHDVSDDGVNLLAVVAAIVSEWRLATTVFSTTFLLGVLVTFLLKPQFQATASFLPQEGSQGTSFASLFSTHSPGALYIGLLKSTAVRNYVIDDAHLLALFHTSSYEDARSTLDGKSTFAEGADNIVTISIKDKNAEDAARIANAYLHGLQHLNDTMAAEQSTHTRAFFDSLIAEQRDALLKAEADLESTEKRTGVIAPESQTQIGLNTIAATRSQVTNLKIQLALLLQSESDQNPQVKALRTQIAQLEAAEGRQEYGLSAPVGAAPAAASMPQSNLDYLRAQRNVKDHDTALTSLSTQFETAWLTGELTKPSFQVIDHAIVPEHKSWPPRKAFLLAAPVFAFLLALFAVVIKLFWLRALADPSSQNSIAAIRQAFGGR